MCSDRFTNERSRPIQVPRWPALFENSTRNARSLRRITWKLRQHPLDSRTRRCQHWVRKRLSTRLSTSPRIRQRWRLPPPFSIWGRKKAVGKSAIRRNRWPLGIRTSCHRRHGLLGLLLNYLGSDQTRPRQRHPSWTRTRIRGGVCCRLLPANNRPGSNQVRPALWKILESGTKVHARHRHGLRWSLPGRNDSLHSWNVRPWTRGTNHYFFDDQSPSGSSRRCTSSGIPICRRGQSC